MPVITMSGEMTSGAREVGRRVATLLGIDFVDQQLMVQAARRCGVPVGAVARHDERSATFRQRVAAAINSMLESSTASGADPAGAGAGLEAVLSQTYADMARPQEEAGITDKRYLETMSTIIREIAASGRVVILGRGSQMILRDVPRVLNVLCVAPPEVRWARVAEQDGITLEEAKKRATGRDQARAAFHRKFWKVDVEDPRLYDVTVNTARLSYDAAAEVIAAAARIKAES
ncbi:MAG TPA: cytidylate kinase-like family protein [Dehalococcoidia bacterium]|jgi:cytidylate kinase|nr:cytidylate kinase-like family protein [Dehalococcoidia bacterium]